MAATKLVEEEGTVLEHALRRIKLGRAESALGMRWVEGKASHSDIGGGGGVQVGGRRRCV